MFFGFGGSMEAEENSQLKQLMSQSQCDNEFRCCNPDSKNICGAKIIGDGRLVDCSKCGSHDCLRENPKTCPMRLSFGIGHFCTCSVRIYLAQHPEAILVKDENQVK
jgi:hypothetical protein